METGNNSLNISITSPDPVSKQEEESVEIYDMGLEEWQAQPLWKKLENLIPRFITCTMNKDFWKKWWWPKVDTDTGLFKEKKDVSKYVNLIK